MGVRGAPDGIEEGDGRFVQEVTHSNLGLGDDFDCAFFEGAQREFGAAGSEAGADDYRSGHLGHDFSDERDAIHTGHFEVGDDYIGRVFLHLSPGDQRVGGDVHFDHAVGAEDGVHYLAHHGGVIDDEDMQLLAMLARLVLWICRCSEGRRSGRVGIRIHWLSLPSALIKMVGSMLRKSGNMLFRFSAWPTKRKPLAMRFRARLATTLRFEAISK